MRNLYLTNRFFGLFGSVALFFVLSYLVSFWFPIAVSIFILAIALTFADFFILFRANVNISGTRKLPKLLSLSDSNRILLSISNHSSQFLTLTVIDELPIQFQERDFEIQLALDAGEEKSVAYELIPKERGEYNFGTINTYASSELGLLQRRFNVGNAATVPVYPSVLQMKQYEMLAFNRLSFQEGLRKIRRLGHSYEFDQIKNYVRGDDYRSVNWKATGRMSKLMVNQYEDERSQQVYCLIDKSRAMKMPFNGLSLVDYAINTSLAILNIVLKKYDKAGLITFSDRIGATIKADRKANQLNKILHTLYKEKIGYSKPIMSCFTILPENSLMAAV